MRPYLEKQAPCKSVRTLYCTRRGWPVMQLMSRRFISKLAGAFHNSFLSKPQIKKFIKRHGIKMEEYLPEKYKNFNAFFTRRIRPECRPFDFAPEAFVSPCDGVVTVYPVTESGVVEIKGFDYTVKTLLGDAALAEKYRGGLCIVFRLTVTDYHRYHFIDDGTIGEKRFIKGRLHTVQPTALEKRRVLGENCREVTVLHTRHFGDVTQVEVGAMMVGRIVNLPKESFVRGEEKGRFEFGGSTVVLFVRAGEIVLDEEFFENTEKGRETVVKCGERIGRKE